MAVSKPSLADAEFGENRLQDFVGGNLSTAGDGADMADDLTDLFAQEIRRKIVAKAFESVA